MDQPVGGVQDASRGCQSFIVRDDTESHEILGLWRVEREGNNDCGSAERIDHIDVQEFKRRGVPLDNLSNRVRRSLRC